MRGRLVSLSERESRDFLLAAPLSSGAVPQTKAL